MRNWREKLLTSQVTRNHYVWLAIALCIAILAVADLQPTVSDALSLAPLPGEVWITLVGFSLVPVIVREVAAAITRLRRNGW
jgi:Ca2+-transporting ATPase